MKRAGVVVAVLVLLAVTGVLGGWRNRGTSPDEVDRASRHRVPLGSAQRFELAEDHADDPLLVEKFAGDVVYDLRAATPETNVRIEHLFGDVTVIAPKGVSVRLMGRYDGLGQWTLSGFRPLGEHLVNDVYQARGDSAEVRLYRGWGSVRLIAADS